MKKIEEDSKQFLPNMQKLISVVFLLGTQLLIIPLLVEYAARLINVEKRIVGFVKKYYSPDVMINTFDSNYFDGNEIESSKNLKIEGNFYFQNENLEKVDGFRLKK